MKYGLKLIGVVLIALGLFIFPAVSVIIAQAPEITDSCPADGMSYTEGWITNILVRVKYAHTVHVFIDELKYELYPDTSNDPLGDIWDSGDMADCPGGSYPSVGVHDLQINVWGDGGPLQTFGSFTVTDALAGTWYINGIEITDPLQQLTLNTQTLTFKFISSAGDAIHCKVVYTGTENGSLTLDYLWGETGNYWEGSHTFAWGSYQMTLTASDGTNIIEMSIGSDIGGIGGTGVHVPGGWGFGNILILAGACLIGFSIFQDLRKRRSLGI